MLFLNALQTKFSNIQIPDMDFGAIAKNVDGFCSMHINTVVAFLDAHPGIAMALSPSTVVRRCAQKHADNQL